MNLLSQVRIAILGTTGVGKSAFIEQLISSALQQQNASLQEHKRIITFVYKDVEYCIYECDEKNISDINKASFIINLVDYNKLNENLIDTNIKIPFVTLYSNSGRNYYPYYDIEKNNLEEVFQIILDFIYYEHSKNIINIEKEALCNIENNVLPENTNIMIFYGDAQSIVGLDLLSKTYMLNNIYVYCPNRDEIIDVANYYSDYYNINIIPMDNMDLIKNKHYFDEMFFIQCKNNKTFNPVITFSQSNILRYISRYNLFIPAEV